MSVSKRCEQCCKQAVCLAFLDNSGYVPLSCPVPSCEVCPSLAQLDAEILLARKHLFELATRRRDVIYAVNDRHNYFARLPAETVHDIFKVYCEDVFPARNKTPLGIGAVCKRWRNITLGMPQLWTNVKIDADIDRPYDLDVASKWLRRSRSLPLSLNINLVAHNKYIHPYSNSFSPLIELLRSHAVRWSNLTIDEMCTSSLLPPLFSDLRTAPSNLEKLDILGSVFSDSRDVGQLLSPKTLRVHYESSMMGLSLGWNQLTSFSVLDLLDIDEVVYIIDNAPNLAFCEVRGVRQGNGQLVSHWQKKPVINHSITHFRTETTEEGLLTYLTLPSLVNFDYTYLCQSAEDRDLVDVQAFLRRSSSPQLKDFNLTILQADWYQHVHLWSGQMIPITSLRFDTSMMKETDEKEDVMNDFLLLLNMALEDGELSRLKHLRISEPTTARLWSLLCNLLEKDNRRGWEQMESRHGSNSGISPAHKGVLKSVIIDIKETCEPPTLCLYPSDFEALCDMNHSGLDISLYSESSRFSFPFKLSRNVDLYLSSP